MSGIKLLPETQEQIQNLMQDSDVAQEANKIAVYLNGFIANKANDPKLIEDTGFRDIKDSALDTSLSFIADAHKYLTYYVFKSSLENYDYKTDKPETLKAELKERIYYKNSFPTIRDQTIDILLNYGEWEDIAYETIRDHNIDSDFARIVRRADNDTHNVELLASSVEGDVHYIPKPDEGNSFEFLTDFANLKFPNDVDKEFEGRISALRHIRELLLSDNEGSLKSVIAVAKDDFDTERKEREKFHKHEHYSTDINPLTGKEIPYYKPQNESAEKLDLYRDSALHLRQLERFEIPEEDFKHGGNLDNEIAIEKVQTAELREQIEPLLEQIEMCEEVDKSLRELDSYVEYGIEKEGLIDNKYTGNPSLIDFLELVMDENMIAYNKAYYNVLWENLGKLTGKDETLAYRFNGVVNLEGVDPEEKNITVNISEPTLEQKIEQLEGVLKGLGWDGELPHNFPKLTSAQDYIDNRDDCKPHRESRNSNDRPVEYKQSQTPKDLYEDIQNRIELATNVREFTAHIAEFSLGKVKDVLDKRVDVIDDQIRKPLTVLGATLSVPFGEEFFDKPSQANNDMTMEAK